MNNNYHTQMDKQNNNMLNEIAANNNLLQQQQQQQQQQMQHFQGTLINKNNQPNTQMNIPTNQQVLRQINPQPNVGTNLQMNPNPQIMQQQMAYAHQLSQQAQQNQLYQQHMNNNIQQNENDEIELSEPKLEQIPKPIQTLDTVKKNQQINNKIQQLIHNPVEGQNQIQTQTQHIIPKNDVKLQNHSKKAINPCPIKYIPVPKQENKVVEYVVIPILLIIVFIFLVHPKTSRILGKYLPKMKTMGGFVVRGSILAIIYLIIRILANSMEKNKNKLS